MAELDRRKIHKNSMFASTPSTGSPSSRNAAGDTSSETKSNSAKAVPPDRDVTRKLARFIVTTKIEDVPSAVRKEATRTLLNWLSVAVGGSHHPTIDNAIAAIAPFSGPAQASVMGRSERFDIISTTLINGMSSHVFDFDDTHLKTIIHASGPIISPCLALSELLPITGQEFLIAITVGMETAFRIGNCVYPNHYDIGWHITGTAGSISAAAATGKLLKLDEQQMVWALGLGASQPVGLRESFGSMNKSFNPGRAGQNGLTASLLAEKNFTSSDLMIEAKRGWANTISTKQDFLQITEGLGHQWEAALNTYKPFACGIVIHPTIDACIQLRNENNLSEDQIQKITLRVHPLVLELTGKKTPKVGLEGKFSVYHAAAVAIVEGKASEKQFSDQSVRTPAIISLRDRVTAIADTTIKEEQADVVILLKDGSTLHKFVKHAVGSLERPMSDDELNMKLMDLAEGILPKAQISRLNDSCWNIERLAQVAALARLAIPS